MAYKSRFLFVNDDGDYEEGMAGGVFITNVQPQNGGDVVDITWKSGVVGNSIVESIETDTEEIIVTVEWNGSAYEWNGEVQVNGVTVTGVSEINSTRRFTGTASIDLSGETLITAIHTDGAKAVCPVTLQGVGPEITNVQFVNGYPGSQTEVKAGDTFDIEVTFEPSGSEPSHIEIQNFGACSFATISVAGSGINWGTTHTGTFTATIDSTSNTVQSLAGRVRARNSFGTFGSTMDTNDGGTTVDGTNLVDCNDVTPQISFGSKTYSSGYDALKDSETATVAFTYSECDTVLFSSPTSELSITNTTTLENPKTVQRVSGNYNVSSNNLRAVGHRDANDTNATINTAVFIAHVDATITVTEPASRLRSGGNDSTSMQNHTITISSNQLLRSVPTLVAPHGTLGSFSGSTPGSSFTATLGVHDNDTKGTHAWGTLSAVNLAGKVQNVISGDGNYTLGGFVERDIYYSAQSMEETMGVQVSDTAKLSAVDKDLIAMTYFNDLNDHSRGFSITQPSLTLNSTGNILYWNDVTDRENNTTGLSFIRIEEVV